MDCNLVAIDCNLVAMDYSLVGVDCNSVVNAKGGDLDPPLVPLRETPMELAFILIDLYV